MADHHPRGVRFYDASNVPGRLMYPAGSLVVVGGPVGAGKTTLVARCADQPVALLSLDECRRDVQQRWGLPRDAYHPECWSDATWDFNDRLTQALAAGENALVDIVNTGDTPRENFCATARQHGRPAHAVYIDATMSECWAAQQGRAAPIPFGTVESYVRDWEHLRDRLAHQPAVTAGQWASVSVLSRPAARALQAIAFA